MISSKHMKSGSAWYFQEKIWYSDYHNDLSYLWFVLGYNKTGVIHHDYSNSTFGAEVS